MLLNPNGKQIIKTFLEKGSDRSMLDLIVFAKEFQLTFGEIAELAKGLASSGQMIRPNGINNYYDIPSTGGPGSLSTLISPLVLSALGKHVLKLGVPGRPAGGIDVLAQIEGYQISPSAEEIENWISSGRFVHIVANNHFTPLDIKFFEFRKKNNAIKIPSLVIASILAKKIAFGINSVGLDIRVSKFGNFGSNWNEARNNAKLFNNVASLLEIQSVCFISNGFCPQQPYIGRGESLLALRKIFEKTDLNYLLKKHLAHCYSMGISLAGGGQDVDLNGSIMEKEFKDNLSLQGGKYDSFLSITESIEKQQEYTITALKSGFIKIDLEKVRESILTIQSEIKDLKYPDPCGLILKVYSSEYVLKGSLLCTFRCEKRFSKTFRDSLQLCFTYDPDINKTNELEVI